jgi:23S rRNA pseudouridine1911/1915/1917 synthase
MVMEAADKGSGGEVKSFAVTEADLGARLDVFLAAALAPDLSRSRVQSLIKSGCVTISGLVVRDRAVLKSGAMIGVTLPPLEEAKPAAEAIALDVLYEDQHLIVINKPSGLTVHPGAGVYDGTLVNALIAHCGDTLSGIGGVKRPGIVHRLDKDTSGVMVVAKHDKAHRHLSKQFADHGRSGALERAYIALVWGAPARPSGTVEASLGRSQTDRTKRAVVSPGQADAREAVTHYVVEQRFGDAKKPAASRVLCRLETGRTHQIRVHMAWLGHPLIGDQLYGRGFFTRVATLPEAAQKAISILHRQALHAAYLAFEHPVTGEVLEFETDPPADFQAVEAALYAIDQAEIGLTKM